MRRLALLAPLLLILTACSVGDVTAPKAPTVQVSTEAMAAKKAAAGIVDCGAVVDDTVDPTVRPAEGLPKVTLPCLGGGSGVRLASLHGPLVINIWQADCAPCKKEMPALQAFHLSHPDVPLVGIDANDTLPGVALDDAISYGVTYPLLADPTGKLQGTTLSIKGYPWFFFVRADGTIASHAGGVTSEAEAEHLITTELGAPS